MAENGRDIPEQPKTAVDKEVRLRTLKERQNEERQKKLEEIKAQALAAQRFKEQKELERRKRLEDMRSKEDQRRLQVEERKKAINDAERDRLESILQRNQERQARIETRKRHERSNIVFAFGSSTPRMLDPTDMTVSFWGHRRATSTQNITSASTGSSLTRRQSERDLDVGSKKRATSAGGLERAGESLTSPTTPAGCASGYLGRRRTDLVPTIPSRDSSFHSSTSRKSLNHSPASSRPSSSLSQQSTNSVTSSLIVKHRVSNTPRRPRPASIAVTGVSSDRHSVDRGENKPPLPKTRKSLSKTNTSEKIEKGTPKSRSAKSPAEETAPKVVGEDKKEVKDTKKQESAQKAPESEQKAPELAQSKEPTPPPQVAETKEASVEKEPVPKPQEPVVEQIPSKEDNVVQIFINTERQAAEETSSETTTQSSVSSVTTETKQVKEETKEEGKQETSETVSSEMTTSISKMRITTEEEAKAALAERRRLIREEAERQAELERQRIEAEQKAELERQQKEEEQARLLAEMQRQAEQERLQEAIREAQRREEEERLRKEEELRQKILKEEADQKAREEAERQKAELQKKLENEEREREERRKRVEMIMSRTRGKNNANNLASQQNSQDKNENASDKGHVDENKLNEENTVNENKLNGTKQENGTTDSTTKNGKDVGIVDNIIPGESVKNANTVTDTINTDSINSNSSWQPTQQYDT